VRRRDFLKALGVFSVANLLPRLASGQGAPPAATAPETTAFSAAYVLEQARALAAKKFVPPKVELPKAFLELNYDQYHDIRFKRERALWNAEGLPFQVEFFHRGFYFKEPVVIYVVADGQARRLAYSPDLFTFGPQVPAPTNGSVTDFSGFRLHAPINRPDSFDEFAVFQGASYFRAVAKGQWYGLSARGLALNTGTPDGEEFPYFRTFWIERPRPEASAIVVHALLDSVSTTGAYRFTIRPGDNTVMDVEMTLVPRVELKQVGLAPLTSMFFFAPHDRLGVDDFRPAVHDSDGLAIWNGRGEWLWRPLINPDTLQVSAFVDNNPRGFGLLQRHRTFTNYEDLEAHYERRPGLWIEAIGNWGEGVVQLVEIPARSEFDDNITAFWHPSQPIPAQSEYRSTYRLHWCWTPAVTPSLATVAQTMMGAGAEKGSRRIVIDFVGKPLTDLKPDAAVEPLLATSAGTIKYATAQYNPVTSGWRVSLVLIPGDATSCDLRCALKQGDTLLSEVWLYRWAL
jgi:periplasmic glucans biosynthesis protein